MKNFRTKTLGLRSIAFSRINEVSGMEFDPYFNDLYKIKKGECRRIKGAFGNVGWVKSNDFKLIKDKFDFEVDGIKIAINEVNKLNSIGGKERMEEMRGSFVEHGQGTAEEYNDKFNNESFYFVITFKPI